MPEKGYKSFTLPVDLWRELKFEALEKEITLTEVVRMLWNHYEARDDDASEGIENPTDGVIDRYKNLKQDGPPIFPDLSRSEREWLEKLLTVLRSENRIAINAVQSAITSSAMVVQYELGNRSDSFGNQNPSGKPRGRDKSSD